MAAILDGAPPLVFDASDQMPVEVGSDLLWFEITRWVSGTTTYDEFAETIDAALVDARARTAAGLASPIGSADGDR